MDITTIKKEFNDKKCEGIAKKAEFDKNEKEIKEIGEVEYSKEEHDNIKDENIKPSHPLSSTSPPAPNPSQHQSLFQ